MMNIQKKRAPSNRIALFPSVVVGHEATGINFNVRLDMSWNFFGLDSDLGTAVWADDEVLNALVAFHSVNI